MLIVRCRNSLVLIAPKILRRLDKNCRSASVTSIFFRTFAATFYEGDASPIKTKQAQMAVKIRLARRGRKKMAMYDIVVAESTSPRDGRFIGPFIGSW
jgi:hypothetical protein